MKPHPRIRKAIKWGGAAVTLLLVVVWIVSGWGQLYWMGRKGRSVIVGGGEVGTVWATDDVDMPVSERGFHTRAFPRYNHSWHFLARHRGTTWLVEVPLWCPLVLSAGASMIAWRLDVLAHRRARLNLCPKCNYDRAGIAADAVCPECGSVGGPS